jgi:hemerythrin-like metal-binding protein
LRAAARPGDESFRTGPGQFLLLLRDSGHEQAEQVAAHVRESLQGTSFVDIGPATVSGAIAQRYPGETIGQWWRRLDSTLAQARAGGGDRIVVDKRRSESDALEHAPGLHLEWQARFECGEPTIDRQHRGLFNLAEDVLDSARRSGSNTAPRVVKLVAAIREHFCTEEAILARYGYQELARHAQSHQLLLEKAQRMQVAVTAGHANREDLLRFLLGEVVADHMLAEDRLFAKVFAGRPGD